MWAVPVRTPVRNRTLGTKIGINDTKRPGNAPGLFIGSASSRAFSRSRWSDSNRRPAVYETAALPLSYTGLWSPRRDSNPGPQSYQDCALPPELRGPRLDTLQYISLLPVVQSRSRLALQSVGLADLAQQRDFEPGMNISIQLSPRFRSQERATRAALAVCRVTRALHAARRAPAPCASPSHWEHLLLITTRRDTTDLLLIRMTPGDANVTFRTTFAATLVATRTGPRRCHAATTLCLSERTHQCGRSSSSSADHWGSAQTILILLVHGGTVGPDIAP